MPIQATDINQSALDNLQAQELTKPKTHIEWKVLETKLWTERALLVEKTAYEMMNAGEIPVMKIKKYPALAWPVPQGYFDSIQAQIKELKAKGITNLTDEEFDKLDELSDKLIALEKQETAKEKQETAKEKQETAKEKQETAKERQETAKKRQETAKAYEGVNLKLSSIKGSLLWK